MTSTRYISLLVLLAACLPVLAVDAQDDGGDADQAPPDLNGPPGMGGGDQACVPFACASPYVPVNRWPLAIESPGCEQPGGTQSMFQAGQEDQMRHIEHCCDRKSACYQLCGSSKAACDAELQKCMERGCEELPALGIDDKEAMDEEELAEEKETCMRMKGLIKLMSDMGGGGCAEFEFHQQSHCECVEKDKLEGAMEKVLRAFYKKFHPASVKKVEGLLEKAAGRRTVFNKILYTLVKKYPAAIKKNKPGTGGMAGGMGGMPGGMGGMKMEF